MKKINIKEIAAAAKRRLLPFVSAAVMALAASGCTLPGERQQMDEDFIPDMDYADEAVNVGQEIINYTWFIEPSITAENIIVFDGSCIDPNVTEVNQMYRTLAVICQNGLYGFIDYNGTVLIKPQYKYYFVDPGGQIVLYNITNEKNDTREYCTMDKEGHIATEYDSHGSSRVRYYYDSENGKVYRSRESDDWAVEVYTDKRAVCAQKAEVYENYGRTELVEPEEGAGGFGIVNGEGEVLLDFEYDDAYAAPYQSPSVTAFALKKDGLWGYFNAKGEKLIDVKCDGVFSAYNGEPNDDLDSGHPYLFSEDLLAVSIGSTFGYYNSDGKCLVKSSEFSQARPVHHKKAWVCLGGKWGIISFGEDEEEPVTTTTTTTTTTTYSWTTTSEEEEEFDYADYFDMTETSADPYADPYATSEVPSETAQTAPVYTDTEPAYTEPVYTDPATAPAPAPAPDNGGGEDYIVF